MASNDSDDSAIASKDSKSTRSTRGKVCLTTLAQQRAKGIIKEVEFNKYGQPVGKVASEMQSYIGLITREHVKINYMTWRHVPQEVKELIWDSVNSSYKVPATWRTGCLESASNKWRVWKSRLYTDFILPNKDNPTKLHKPPPDSGILLVDWGQFVISRMSDEFKNLSDKQKDRRNKLVYPHRLSRKGYAGLAESMKEELYGDEEIDRAIMWKKARLSKEGDTKDENLKMTVQKIDKYIREKEDGVFKSKDRYSDLLTSALEKPEHSGRVRGIGAYVNPTRYFNCPRETRQRISKEQLDVLEDAKKRIQEQDYVLKEYDARIHLQDKVICELVDRIGKLEESVSVKDKLHEEKSSCSVKYSLHHKEDEGDYCIDGEEVVLIDKVATLLGKSVALALGSTKTIVGYGTVVKTKNTLHGAPMPKDCLCVSIDEVVDEDALLPFPIPCISDIVGNAIGSHVAWPSKLVVPKYGICPKKMVEKKTGKEKMIRYYASLPSSLKALYCCVERSYKDGQGILLPLDVDVFGSTCDIFIHLEDITPFCELEPISGNCIVAYIWHMYKRLKEENTNDRFIFVNPFTISYAPKVERDDRARVLADRLFKASSNQLVVVPCNVGEHWILTIVQPHKELVVLMDPLTHRNRDNTWKYVVDSAMNMFNVNVGKKSKKAPAWEIIKGPIQPDSKQCGYYVMRFMKEIAKGFKKNDSISLKSMFQKKGYSQDEINEVREEWASCVIDHI